jgi:hypothetical protein
MGRDMEKFYVTEIKRELSHPDLVKSFLASSIAHVEKEEEETPSVKMNILDDVNGVSGETGEYSERPENGNASSVDNKNNIETTQSVSSSVHSKGKPFLGRDFTDSNRAKLEEILGAFEEPEVAGQNENVSGCES